MYKPLQVYYTCLLIHRFLTYHCLLHNETSWCQPGSQPPLKQTKKQTQSQNLMHKTDSTVTTEHVHSQSSTEATSQQSMAKTSTDDQDKSSEIPTSYSSNTSDATNSNNIVHPQKSDRVHLQRSNATANDQDYSNNTQSNNQTHSPSLYTGMQL